MQDDVQKKGRVEPGLVSTIIPVYNRGALLREAIDSVMTQTYRPIEIIIADDGSTDDTPAAAQELARKHPDIIRYVRIENSGPGPAREAGRRIAAGEFIQYLDSDDRLLPEKFSLQVAALKDNPDCDIAYGITRLINSRGQILADPFKSTGRKIVYLFPDLLVDRWWCTHTPLYRRSLCDKIGPWSDLRFSQDWEYDGRAGALGARLVWCNATVSEHRQHAATRQTGSGRWLRPDQQVKFFGRIYRHAGQAGCTINQAEMHHFSRWVFCMARACGKAGACIEADELMAMVRKHTLSPDFSMKTVSAARKLFGWRFTGALCGLIDRLRCGFGPYSRPLSWNDNGSNPV